ncbi:Pyrimidine 5-nucleotidase [Paramicrosporidium saccamoebae]|uniref:Pyrimidine 5-nucleotidase n=1 Tax=Paramicrosporidium saccamoebae TaxID=1246581 RepID=A0A2H9TJ52_9FUNG|nr:Pyrimidine 5-nucleotidase [Paramicrosporidium saccamoebae]
MYIVPLACAFAALVAAARPAHKILRELTKERTLLLDLDDTLYSAASGLLESLITANRSYIAHSIKCTEAEANQLDEQYYRGYGLAIRGLMAEHDVNPRTYEEFLDNTIDYNLIDIDHALFSVLDSVKANIVIYTNSGVMHAERVLSELGVHKLVNAIVYGDHTSQGYYLKPNVESYIRVENLLNAKPGQLYFVDDRKKNVEVALSRGWNGAQVVETGDSVVPSSKGMKQMSKVHELPTIFPELFS